MTKSQQTLVNQPQMFPPNFKLTSMSLIQRTPGLVGDCNSGHYTTSSTTPGRTALDVFKCSLKNNEAECSKCRCLSSPSRVPTSTSLPSVGRRWQSWCHGLLPPHKSSILRVPTIRKTETCARERHLTCAMFLPTQLCSSGAEPTLLLLEAGHKLQNPLYLQLPAYPLSRATTLPSNTHYQFQTLASQKENCL